MEKSIQQNLPTNSIERSEIRVKLPDPSGSGEMKMIKLDNTVPAGKNKKFMAAFSLMLLASSGRAEFKNPYELPMLKEALIKNDVTPQEAYNAFWKAYGDQYTPSSGIKWRNLWKHIEEARMGRDRQLYSFREVLNIVDKEQITTEHFKRNDKKAQKVKNGNPEMDIKDIRCWKRK